MVTNNGRCLNLFGPLAQQFKLLWRRQLVDWDALQVGLTHLSQAMTRSFDVAGTHVIAQCNPARIKSASANIDPDAISERPCFLCEKNLPPLQQAIAYRDNWLVLCNPAPIFDHHFTIVSQKHEPQRILPVIDIVLELARDLDGHYTIFYNGPVCGASAPDHMHFQAAPSGVTPFEGELAAALCTDHHSDGQRWIQWLRLNPVHVGVSRPSHRPVVLFIAESAEPLVETIEETIETLGIIHPAEPEPMLNLFATYTDEHWLVWFYPRRDHRPSCYGQHEDAYLVSPGAVDLAGLLITPRREDFERIDASVIASIYNEILLSPSLFAQLRERLKDGHNLSNPTLALE